jgi:2,3-bisphosphoglycerate-independent phosphoglycerate mutase
MQRGGGIFQKSIYRASVTSAMIGPMKTLPSAPRPVVLCILDGWGLRSEAVDNAILLARTPVWDRLSATSPTARLNASELHVGLPSGQMGNSEVGHMNLGAGRVVMQDLPRIDRALNCPDVQNGALATDPTLARFVAAMRGSGGEVHLMGLLSPGGVHSHQDHIAGLARLLTEFGLPVVIHAFLDGRDTPPSSARDFLSRFLADLPGGATLGTVCGRFYAMDRDKRWDRVDLAYRAMVDAEGPKAADGFAAIDAAAARGETDEFVLPTVLAGYSGMRDGDGLMMANFRSDRARETLTALLDPAFDGFIRPRRPHFAASLGMVEYSSALNPFMPALFPATTLLDTLGATLSAAGKRQLRIAETEKYAHVTFFFNGGEEKVFDGEERILVPSPAVRTYDLQPEMSAPEVTDRLVEAIGSGRFDFIVANYANTDMVGHTGILTAAITAVEAVDACLGRLETAVRAGGGLMLVTADHGNAEEMRDPTSGEAHTQHTLNPVPVILVGAGSAAVTLQDGTLADVAPTVLALMGLPQPAAMTGRSLLKRLAQAEAAD